MPSRKVPPRLLVIRERDVGLFSMVLQVLHALFLLKDQKIDRIPLVVLGRGIIYFHPDGHESHRTAWEYYFKPLVPEFSENHILTVLGDCAFELLESKRKQLEHARGATEFPQDLHLLSPLTTQDRSNLAQLDELVTPFDWAWTESFYPTVDGRSCGQFEISYSYYADLVRRYIRPRDHIQRKVSELFDARLRGYYVIGVHVRGTDGHSAPSGGVEIPFDRYFYEIEQKFATFGKSACRVFLATDEQNVVSRFEKRFGEELVHYDAVRNIDGEEVFGVGPTGQVMPGYIGKGGTTAVQNGDDAVVEYALLCRSDFLVHNVSSLSATACFSVPESVHV